MNNLCPARLPLLIENPAFILKLFERITKTNDPDVLNQSLEILIHITGSTDGLNVICALTEFPFAFLLSVTKNEYTRNQMFALEVLSKVADCSHRFYVSKFKDPLFMEEIFFILEVSNECGFCRS